MDFHKRETVPYALYLNDREYQLINVTIVKSPTPVTEPTTRGGVFFSDKFAYKIKGTVHDLSIIPHLSKSMLGPNTEFGEILITTQIENNGKKIKLSLSTNLTNSVQNSSEIELNMILIKLESV